MKKQYRRFFVSGVIISLLAVQLSFADELPLQAKKPGQARIKTEDNPSAEDDPAKNSEATTEKTNSGQSKFRVTSRRQVKRICVILWELLPSPYLLHWRLS